LDILQSPAKSFDNIDGLQVAADADTRLFISSKSVQTYLDQTWFGLLYNISKRQSFVLI